MTIPVIMHDLKSFGNDRLRDSLPRFTRTHLQPDLLMNMV